MKAIKTNQLTLAAVNVYAAVRYCCAGLGFFIFWILAGCISIAVFVTL